MKTNKAVLVGTLLSSIFIALGSHAQQTNALDLIQQLQRRIDELEHKVKDLERSNGQAAATADSRQRELDEKMRLLQRQREPASTAGTSQPAPALSLGANGLVVRSADSNFLMNIHGYAQADARLYPRDHDLINDTLLVRRVRPIIEGVVFDRFDYRLMADFGSGTVSGSSAGNVGILDDAYVNARLARQFQVQIGKYKSPVGLERLKSTADLVFVETGFATQLTPNYDLGVTLHNELFNSPLNYSVGVFNGAADAASDNQDVNEEGKDLVARVFLQPFLRTQLTPLRGLGFGVAGSYGDHLGALPSYKTPGQQSLYAYTNGVTADGTQYRVDPQFFYYWGPFGILGEYVLSSQKISSSRRNPGHARLDNTAWQVQASWFLTGEANTFKSPVPLNPFLVDGGWGAFELAARVEQMTFDDKAFPRFATPASARQTTSWGVGANWYLNRNVKVNLDYQRTWFSGVSKGKGTVTQDDEHVILGRVQFGF